MALSAAKVTRAQARLVSMETFAVHAGQILESVGSGAITDPNMLGVLTLMLETIKQNLLSLEAGLTEAGAPTPIDQPDAILKRTRVQQMMPVIAHLGQTAAKLISASHIDEDGKTVIELTADQKAALEADIGRARTKLVGLIEQL